MLQISCKEEIVHYKINENGNIWVLFSNRTINIYRKVAYHYYEEDNQDFEMQLKIMN